MPALAGMAPAGGFTVALGHIAARAWQAPASARELDALLACCAPNWPTGRWASAS